MAGLLATLRGVAKSDASIRAGGFDKPMGRLLRNKTIGLVGFGKVARALARLLAPWGTTLLASDLVHDNDAAATLAVRYVSFDELLTASDVVSLHLPYAKAAHHLIGPAQLAKLKPDAIVVNTSRGGLVDEVALIAHLQAHPKAGAYLDCFEKEPYQGPLTALTNAVLTSHIGSYAREARVRMETEAVENLLRALAT
jgi:D-3-phosphoglycerate dehydrogenase